MGGVSIADAFRDEEAARQFLGSPLESCALPPDTLLPICKWVQAIYLTDAGTLKVSPEHLARLLDVPVTIARKVVGHCEKMDGAAAIAKRIAANLGGNPVMAGLVGSLFLLGHSLQLSSVGFDPALFGLG